MTNAVSKFVANHNMDHHGRVPPTYVDAGQLTSGGGSVAITVPAGAVYCIIKTDQIVYFASGATPTAVLPSTSPAVGAGSTMIQGPYKEERFKVDQVAEIALITAATTANYSVEFYAT